MNPRKLRLSLALLGCLAWLSAQAGSAMDGPTSTLPSQTDARIQHFDQPHLSWVPQGSPRHQLVVYLPGTGGHPNPRSLLPEVATRLGFHFVSLMYPDAVSAQRACRESESPAAYTAFRTAIIEGGRYEQLVVPPAESIENRLTQLLVYLRRSQPREGWGEYLAGDRIAWSKIVIAGHSQGGGHAYLIGKMHPVARVVMLSSPKDYSERFHAPAAEFEATGATPPQREFAFNHVRDTQAYCNHDQQMECFQKMGLTILGSADADSPQHDYRRAHLLFTDVQLAGGNPHGATLGNGQYIGQTAESLCVPAWTYMLTAPTP
jgi:pimeloyl-ACP methyl ester carboxylesterase